MNIEPSQPGSAPTRTLAHIGRPVLHAFRASKNLADLFLDTFVAIARGRTTRRAVLAQCFEIGNRSLPFILITLAVLGFISVYQVATQISQVLPDYTMLGAAFIQMMCREFAPTITGLMVATRVGSGIAAEVGSMVVTEQVDALRLCAADPVDFLVVPRFLASLVMTLMVVVLSSAFAYGTGAVTAFVAFDVRFDVFANLTLIDFGDVMTGLAKCVAYGAAIPICSCHCGLEAYGGSAGVGRATTAAVVLSSLAIIVLNFFISAGAFLVGL